MPSPVLVGNSGSNILVVEPTQDRHGQGLTDGLDRARDRRVFLQGQMGAHLVVVLLICVEQMTKVPLAKHDDMVKAIPPDGSNEPFSTSVLPWRPHCNRPIPNTHRSQPTENGMAIDAITVANDVARRPLPPVCLGQLAGNPFRCRMRRDTHPQKLATTMLQDQQSYNSRKEIVGTRNRSIDAMPSA